MREDAKKNVGMAGHGMVWPKISCCGRTFLLVMLIVDQGNGGEPAEPK